jgi:hypothetical protein
LFAGRAELVCEFSGQGRLPATKADALRAVKAAICARLGCKPVDSAKRKLGIKLRRMTEGRGCTPNEAANARAMLQKSVT